MVEDANNGLTRALMMGRDGAAAVVYRDLKDSQRATFQVAADLGRWLVASLLLVHAGALFGLFSFLDSLAGEPASIQAYKWPIWCFVIGLLAALLCGFCAWVNWSMHSNNYEHMARYDMLWDPEKWAGDPPHSKGLWWTNVLSIAAGWTSALCIAIGAALILHGEYLAEFVGG